MKINVLGEVIETDHIYRITAISHDYYNNKLNNFYFRIFFKDGSSSYEVRLYGTALYRDARIKWDDANDALYQIRLNILREKVNAIRERILAIWTKDQGVVPEIMFDVSIPEIDLRKDGVSIVKVSSFMPSPFHDKHSGRHGGFLGL